ncbi:MAG: glycosyltransferase [Pseudomonadota bacterium]
MTSSPATPLRVLHVGKYFPPYRGGMETFLRSLMAEQQRQGLEVAALVHNEESSFTSRASIYDWKDQSLPVDRVARWATFAFTPVSPSFPFRLARAIKQFAPDVLHLHMPNVSAFYCLLVPSARSRPWVIHWHSDVPKSKHSVLLRLLYSLYRIPEQILLKKARRVIATSPPYLASSEPLSSHADRCVVVPLGIEEEPPEEQFQDRWPAEDSRVSNALHVLAVGRLTYYKGFEFLLDAVRLEPRIRLTLVGDGENCVALQEAVKAKGISERVTFLRECDDATLQHLFVEADVLCMSSIERTEAFGVVLLEAMRSQLPCIVTDVAGSGMRWVVDAPSAGIAIEPENAEALAQAFATVLEHPQTLPRIAKAGSDRFKSHFTIDRCGSQIRKVYMDSVT